jgi:hypothetical protein
MPKATFRVASRMNGCEEHGNFFSTVVHFRRIIFLSKSYNAHCYRYSKFKKRKEKLHWKCKRLTGVQQKNFSVSNFFTLLDIVLETFFQLVRPTLL